LKGGIAWELLPREPGCGSGMTYRRRLRDWQQAGVWERLHQVLLQRLADGDKLDWSRAGLDSAGVPAKGGANTSGRTRRIAVNRARGAMLWSSAEASPSRESSRRPTSTTRGSWRPRWMPSPRSANRAGARPALPAPHEAARGQGLRLPALARLGRFRWLTVRYERRADIHRTFLSLGCALVCWQMLHAQFS